MPGQCEGTLIHLETDVTNQRDCQERTQQYLVVTGRGGKVGEHLVLSKQSNNLYCVIADNLQEFLGLQLLHLQRRGPTLRALRDLPDDLGGVLPLGMRLQPARLRSGN